MYEHEHACKGFLVNRKISEKMEYSRRKHILAVPRENQHYGLCVLYRSRAASAVVTQANPDRHIPSHGSRGIE